MKKDWQAILEEVKNPPMYVTFVIDKGTPTKKQLSLWRRTFASVEKEWDFICDLTASQCEELKQLGVRDF